MKSGKNSFDNAIKKVLEALPDRTRSVIERRYGLFGGNPMTLEAIGKQEGITRERVRQIENDALRRIREADAYDALKEAFAAIDALLVENGGVITEERFRQDDIFTNQHDQNASLFLLELADFAEREKENSNFYSRWAHKNADKKSLEKLLAEFVKEIKSETDSQAYTQSEFFDRLTKKVCDTATSTAPGALKSFVHVCKHLDKNAWDEYGHVTSRVVHPRGMKDEAYIALRKAGEPLHFTEIARRIKTRDGRNVHTQTVHNELIKDARFVLVGRGLYALKEWGYEPGFVKDVLVDILKKGPQDVDGIVNAVSAKRFVKKSTVVTNLQNKEVFMQIEDGRYALVS